jgi:hypothetical protein
MSEIKVIRKRIIPIIIPNSRPCRVGFNRNVENTPHPAQRSIINPRITFKEGNVKRDE